MGRTLRVATCCGNVNLKYDNEISGSQYTRPAPIMERVLDLLWYCYDRWRASREGWSDVPHCVQSTLHLALPWWLATALHPLGLWYGFAFAFEAGLFWSMWQVSLISQHLKAPFGGWKDKLLMCCVSRISLSFLFGHEYPAWQLIVPLLFGKLHLNSLCSQAVPDGSSLMVNVCAF